MNESESLYHLAKFADVCFLPWTAPVCAATRRPEVSAAEAGRALEAVLWLRLAVGLKIFPEATARRLLSYVKTDLRRLLDSHTHVLRPPFPIYYWQVLKRILSESGDLALDASLHRGADASRGAYESALSLRLNAWRSSSEQACEVLTFGSETVWRRAVGFNSEASSDNRLRTDSFLSATVHILMYLLDLERFATDLLADAGMDKAGAIGIIGEVFSIQAWRLNLNLSNVRGAFYVCLSVAGERLAVETGRGDFWKETSLDLEFLIERWKENARFAGDAIFEAATV